MESLPNFLQYKGEPSTFAQTLDTLFRSEFERRVSLPPMLSSRAAKKLWPKTTEWIAAHGFSTELSCGGSKIVSLHEAENMVLKFPFRGDFDATSHPMQQEIAFLESVPEEYDYLFPKTTCIGNGVLLQEFCPTHLLRTGKMYQELEKVALCFGIWDFSVHNVGWRMDEFVFLDFEDTTPLFFTQSERKSTNSYINRAYKMLSKQSLSKHGF